VVGETLPELQSQVGHCPLPPGKTKIHEEKLYQLCLVHHKFHMNCMEANLVLWNEKLETNTLGNSMA
jgi:hypothetical protein